MKTYRELIPILDQGLHELFGSEKEGFSPIFITPIEKIKLLLDDCYISEAIFSQEPFISFWHQQIIEAYSVGIYWHTLKILEKEKGKFNSFKPGEEKERSLKCEQYKNLFNQYILKKLEN